MNTHYAKTTGSFGDSKSSRPRIVIRGSGFAGAYTAQALHTMRRRLDADVLMIDHHNYFVFYPLLVEAGTGSLEPRHTVVPIRDFTGDCEFRMARVRRVDVEARTVTYRLIGSEEDEAVRYDQLVLALGSVTRLPREVLGLHKYGRQMKSLADAVSLRDWAIELLERANASPEASIRRALLRFVVVGGNFTGAEVAGEFDMFLKAATRRYPNLCREDCQICLIEIDDRILRPLGGDLSTYALHHLRKRGVDVRLESSVVEVHADHVTLVSNERLDTHTVIWCAGIEPNPLIKSIDVPTDERGYILCERDLRVKSFDDVWAIGDGAVNINAEGRAYPATAQHATRQGRHCAKNLFAVLEGRSTSPCDLADLGSLAGLGCRTGVARVFGFKFSGFLAWWLWRTVYWMKMPGLARKARLSLDWTLDLFFSRDFVQLGVHRATDSFESLSTEETDATGPEKVPLDSTGPDSI